MKNISIPPGKVPTIDAGKFYFTYNIEFKTIDIHIAFTRITFGDMDLEYFDHIIYFTNLTRWPFLIWSAQGKDVYFTDCKPI